MGKGLLWWTSGWLSLNPCKWTRQQEITRKRTRTRSNIRNFSPAVASNKLKSSSVLKYPKGTSATCINKTLSEFLYKVIYTRLSWILCSVSMSRSLRNIHQKSRNMFSRAQFDTFAEETDQASTACHTHSAQKKSATIQRSRRDPRTSECLRQ